MDSQAPAHPPDQGPVIIAVAIVFIVITSIIVPLRFYARYLARAGFWWDDWLLLVAYVVITASNCTRWWFVKNGLGQHITDVDPAKLEFFFKVLWADMFLYNCSISIVKLGVIAFYFRTFTGPILRILLWVSAGIIVALLIGSTFVVLFQCVPVYKFWDQATPGTCIKFTDYIITQAIPNIVTDIIVLTLPIPSLYRLVVSPAKKMALFCVFVVGYFVTCISVSRAIIIVHVNPNNHPDFTWNFVQPNLWSMLEQDVALICACFPPLAILVREMKSRLGMGSQVSRTAKSHSGNSSGNGSGLSYGSHKKWFSMIDSPTHTAHDHHSTEESLHADNMPLHVVQVKQEYRVEASAASPV